MVDNELITKVRTRNVKSILSNVFTSSGGGGGTWGSITGTLSSQTDLQAALDAKADDLTNGNGTTANGSAVDLGGTQNANIAINDGGTHSWSIQYPSSFRVDDASGNTFNMAGGSGITISTSAGLTLSSPSVPFILNVGSDATGDTYHRNSLGYLTRRGIITATSTATLTPNSDTTYQSCLTAQAEALTIANPTGTPFNGQDLIVRVDSAGAYAITFGAQFRPIGTALPTITTAGKVLYICSLWNAADSKWDTVNHVEV